MRLGGLERIVVALGGNALLERGQAPGIAPQRANVTVAAQAVTPLAAGRDLVITHGNGPQVGLLALQAAAAGAEASVPPYPLDVLGAETEGMIGYLIEQELARRLPPERRCAALLTQVEVDPQDPAFAAPTKFIGRGYPRAEAETLARRFGWQVRPDGERWRRVVPSPRPRRIVEQAVIELLLEHHVVVVCAGGGGIPVLRAPRGGLVGVEAVVDKDASSALLASALGADALLLLTDVEGVFEGWGTPRARALRRVTPATLRGMEFPPGSMGPKVAAACDFVEGGGRVAAIGRLRDAGDLLAGRAGTTVTGAAPATEWWPAIRGA